MLVSRFLIHLQAAERGAQPLDGPGIGTQISQSEELDSGTSIVFNRVVGSLQCSLSPEDFTEGPTHVGDDMPNAGGIGEGLTYPKA